jgi:acyl transferase domain-containing protein/NADPH:quinone reductase-like Zn-dependent oxidoreductase/SAM-dependent methyltransferase/acyl carrier protein
MKFGSIAIVGASCRFPSAPTLRSFWSLLIGGKQAIGEVGESRWATGFYGHPRASELGKSYTWAAGLLDEIDGFDPGFFGISAREAAQIDPQQRLLLELAAEAFDDGGLVPQALRGSAMGVYVGASAMEYSNRVIGDLAAADAYFMTGTSLSILSNRISYTFDLHGPSLTVDTACSSSLVAVHLACEDLRRGRIESALVGGVNLLLSPFPFVGFSRAGMLSKTGRCHSFDARADGYVRGEGGGVILLKPLEKALADGDRIRAVILGSGTNSDGRTVGMSLPSRASQAALLRSVYEAAAVDPERLCFIEAHGTGTAVGDPIEAGAIGDILGARRSQPLPIGSVKTNIGHLEAAAGMAGLLKSVMALEHGVLPRSLNYETPNPRIDFARLQIAVADSPIALDPAAAGAVAGVNSFGFGGTNAHVILGASPPRQAPACDGAVLSPLLLSAASEPALRALAGRWAERLETASDAEIPGLIRTAARRRGHLASRLAALDKDRAGLLASLNAFATGAPSRSIVSDGGARPDRPVFVFSGNGAQWAGMGRDALGANACFRAALTEVDALLQPLLDWSVIRMLETITDQAEIARTDIAQPLIFAVQVATVAALRDQGIEPAATVGHSIGEIAAAWAAGALSLEDAVHLVVARSRQQQRTAGLGRMAVLGLGIDEAKAAFAELGAEVEIAGINAGRSLTVAGPLAELKKIEAVAKKRRWVFTFLDLDYAFHTSFMEMIKEDVIASLQHLRPRPPQLPFMSTVTAAVISGADLDAHYWWLNIREPVRFGEAIRRLVDDGHGLFLEIGPHPVLQSYVRDALQAAGVPGKSLATLTRKAGEGDPFLRIAAACHVAGADLSKSARYAGPVVLDDLPVYPWQRDRFWFQPTSEGLDFARLRHEHPLLGYRWDAEGVEWTSHLDPLLFPWLEDHKVDKSVVLPAAAIVETLLAVASSRFPKAPTLEVRDLEIFRAITLDGQRLRACRIRLDAEGGCQFDSRARLSTDPWTQNAAAVIDGTDEPVVAFAAPLGAPSEVIEGPTLYRAALAVGLDYGPEFQRVEKVEIFPSGDAVVSFRPVEPIPGLAVDPRLLDGALQGVLGIVMSRREAGSGAPLMLPWRFDRIRWARGEGRQPQFAHIGLRYLSDRTVVTDIVLLDRAKTPILAIRGSAMRAARMSRRLALEEKVFHIEQRPAPLASAAVDLTVLDRLRLAIAPRALIADEVPPETVLLIDGFIAASALRALSASIPAGTQFTVASAVESRIFSVQAAPLVISLLRHLEASGCAVEEDGSWSLAPADDLPDPVEIWRSLYVQRPDLAAVTALLAAAGAALPERLVKDTPAPPLPAAMREQFLNAGAPGVQQVETLAAALAAFSRDWPAERPLRVLELGAGSGLLARRLLPRLAHLGCAVDYIAADPNPDSAYLRAEVLEPFDGATVATWDPRVPQPADGRAETMVDVIISAGFLTLEHVELDGLHAIRGRLNQNGVLLALEPEPNALWDLVLGQSGSWWLGDPPSSPLRPSAAWSHLLAQAGFAAIDRQMLAQEPWPFGVLTAATMERGMSIEPPTAADVRTVVLVGDHDEKLLQAVATTLAGAGINHQAVARDEIDSHLGHRVAGLAAAGAAPVVVVLPPALASTAPAGIRAIDRLAEVAAVVRALGSVECRLWLVTGGHADPAESAVTGLGRVIANEMPQSKCRRVGLDRSLDEAGAARVLLDELRHGDADAEIQVSTAGRFAARLRRGLGLVPGAREPCVRLVLPEQGSIDSLRWESLPKREPVGDQIVIKVEAAGLNFRDVMWAMGLLPEEALVYGFAGATLGMECAGTVTAVGPEVTGLAPGDRVMAFASASLASETVTRAMCAIPLPDGFSFADGTTVPVAFLTVLYALAKLAGLKAGETVLIHGAAGAVGLAAVQYAQYVGATVIATAGSDIKRALLRNLGVEHVLDSRSLRFADDTLAITGGKGVDVVLNSLSGDAMRRSLDLLKPFGRFLELGKRDFYMNSRIGLRPVRHNISYFAIDADELVSQHPEVAAELLADLRRMFAEGVLHPLPHMIMPFSEVVDAFRLMRASGHIGKIVLVPDPAGLAIARPRDEHRFRGDRSFVVTGGVSGFGLATAGWLVQSGARHLVLLGRRGTATPGIDAAIAALRVQGAEDVRVFSCDVANPPMLASVLDEIRQSMPPIGGVVHAAMVVEDGLVAGVERDAVAKVVTPKLIGAETLDRLTRSDPIELFLMFSSATTLMGSPGQGSYVAANAALEGLARQRHAAGLPALAVGWGPIEDSGYLADRQDLRDALSSRLGAVPLKTADALGSLPALLASPIPALAFAEVNWARGRGLLPILEEPMFAAVVRDAEGHQESGGIEELLANKSPDEIMEILQGILMDEVSHILRVPRDKIEVGRPLPEIGMDSLMAVELKLGLERRLNIDVPALVINEGLTLRALAARIFTMLTGDGGDQTQAAVVSQHIGDASEAQRIADAVADDGVSAHRAARGAA